MLEGQKVMCEGDLERTEYIEADLEAVFAGSITSNALLEGYDKVT